MSSKASAGQTTIAQRLRKELVKYGIVSGYLFISFSLLLLYDATASGGGRDVLPFGIALVKALVLGKFLLIGEALKVGSRANAHPLLYRVALKSLAFLVVLLVFKAIEELVVGLLHQKTVGAVFGEMAQRGWLENLAPVLVMLLILIPLVAISESYRQLGPTRFRELWLE
jgi:hypothetical protein